MRNLNDDDLGRIDGGADLNVEPDLGDDINPGFGLEPPGAGDGGGAGDGVDTPSSGGIGGGGGLYDPFKG